MLAFILISLFQIKSIKSLKCLLLLFLLCLMNSSYNAQILGLSEGETCNKNGTCKSLTACQSALQGLKKNIRPVICSIKTANTAIVCCPQSNSNNVVTNTKYGPSSNVDTYSASEMCHEYSKLIWKTVYDPVLSSSQSTIQVKDCVDVKTLIIGGKKAQLKEFPHMALIGKGEKPGNWVCGGSLISNRWVLSAAHCTKAGTLRWVRLGELDYISDDDGAHPVDYKIIDLKFHPQYNGNFSRYNDIILLKLDKNVIFSPHMRPVCLNVESSIKETKTVASGWGTMEFAGFSSEHLLKVTLNIHSINDCMKTYMNDKYLPAGLNVNSQICAGDISGEKDTCQGDSGGPIHIVNSKYECMYTQIGITSFGKNCGVQNQLAIYTKVSHFIPWIEKIVWPKN